MTRIELETRIAAPPERCFDLSLDVELHLNSMAHTSERVVSGRTTGRFELGDTVTWEARHLGRRRTMTVRITACDRPRMFRDEQVDGPFRRFVHTHVFEPVDGGTLMRDVLELSAPGALLLGMYLRRLLERRNAVLREAAESL